MINKPKSLPVETLRGITIILVVMGHVIGSNFTGGMQVADNSIYRYLYCLLENLRMPLFTVISGWVYALHPVDKSKISTFIIKKGRRLLLPMICVGTTYFILQYLVPGTNQKEDLLDIWRIYIYPYTYFWYLPALFLVFSAVVLLEITNCMSTFKKWIIVVVISWALCFSELSHFIPASVPNLFAFKNMLFLLPFFVLGVGLNRFRQVLYTRSMLVVFVIGTVAGILLQQIDYFREIPLYELLHLPVIIGMFSAALIMNSRFKSSFFVWIAQYAYTIYLFHGFGTSGGRIILKWLHINNDFVIFVFATAVALFAPVLVEKILIKNKLLRMLFLGKK